MNCGHNIPINLEFHLKKIEKIANLIETYIFNLYFKVTRARGVNPQTSGVNPQTGWVSSIKARFPLGEFFRANRQKSRNASYLFAANFFASQF